MPSPGAVPQDKYDALDLGRGDDGVWRIATRYSDGSYVIWNGEGANEELAYIEPGRSDPVDIGGGRAVVVRPDMALDVFPIGNPPPQYRGAPAPGAAPNPTAPTGPVGTRRPGEDFNYGPTRPGTGLYPAGQDGQTVAPTTPQTRGAGVEGIPYGWGVPSFGADPIRIRDENLAGLADPRLAPGYIPGSGTYNQYRLDTPGRFGQPSLFGPVSGATNRAPVNLRYGLGGPGDPTTGAEVQTPQRWITGNATDSVNALQGDAMWRASHGGGGGWDQAWAAAAPAYTPGPGVSAPAGGLNAAGYGASGWEYVQPGVAPEGVRQRGAGGGMGGGGM